MNPHGDHEILNSQPSTLNFSLYLHIPFCRRLCPFCHFYKVPDIPAWRVYLESVRRELDSFRPEDVGSLRTLYIGGGTPTLFPAEFFMGLFHFLGERFGLSALEESTIETDGQTTARQLDSLVEAGFDRISIGVKSFLPHSRELLGIGPWPWPEPVAESRRAGFSSVGIDLVYGIEGQFLEEFLDDLGQAADMRPDHVSLYSLEESDETGPREGDPDLAAAMFRESRRVLTACGYRQYEITNFARPGHPSRHNTSYWQDHDYIGIGPSAHSSLTRNGVRLRWRNLPDVVRYLKDPVGCREDLSSQHGLDRAREALILGLRMNQGVARGPFTRRYGYDPLEILRTHLPVLREAGLLRYSAERIRLTARGMLLSNEVFVRLI